MTNTPTPTTAAEIKKLAEVEIAGWVDCPEQYLPSNVKIARAYLALTAPQVSTTAGGDARIDAALKLAEDRCFNEDHDGLDDDEVDEICWALFRIGQNPALSPAQPPAPVPAVGDDLQAARAEAALLRATVDYAVGQFKHAMTAFGVSRPMKKAMAETVDAIEKVATTPNAAAFLAEYNALKSRTPKPSGEVEEVAREWLFRRGIGASLAQDMRDEDAKSLASMIQALLDGRGKEGLGPDEAAHSTWCATRINRGYAAECDCWPRGGAGRSVER